MIDVFENDLMYGYVVSMPRLSTKTFDYTIKWDMSRLPYGSHISQYSRCTSVANKNALKLHLHMDINRVKTGNYTFT